jgi:hypothetical protein
MLVAAALAGGRCATLSVSADGPLATLAAARDKIREMRRAGDRSPMTVLVRGGTLFRTRPSF